MRFFIATLLLLVMAIRSPAQQQSAAQILDAGKPFQAYSARDLLIAQATLLSQLVYGQVLSPSVILAQGAQFYALSDRDLEVAVVTLLNQWQGSGTSLPMLLTPPHIGVGQSLPGYNPQSLSPGLVVSPANTAGIVRSVYFVPDIAGNNFLNTTNGTNVYFQVFVDNGGITNNPSTDFLAIDVPLANLFGDKFRFSTNGPYNVLRDSVYLWTQDTSSNAFFGSYVKAADVRLPMYFTNGIVCRLFNKTANTLWQNGYMQVYYETGALSAPFLTQRLRTGSFFGKPPDGTNTLISRAGGPGMIVGFMGSYYASNGVDWTDTIEPVFQTSSNKTWVGSGYSDFYRDPYSMVNQMVIASSHGTVNSWIQSAGTQPGAGFSQSAFECYRWFNNDHIVFDAGAGLQVIGWGLLTNVVQDITVWYYAP